MIGCVVQFIQRQSIVACRPFDVSYRTHHYVQWLTPPGLTPTISILTIANNSTPSSKDNNNQDQADYEPLSNEPSLSLVTNEAKCEERSISKVSHKPHPVGDKVKKISNEPQLDTDMVKKVSARLTRKMKLKAKLSKKRLLKTAQLTTHWLYCLSCHCLLAFCFVHYECLSCSAPQLTFQTSHVLKNINTVIVDVHIDFKLIVCSLYQTSYWWNHLFVSSEIYHIQYYYSLRGKYFIA